MVLLGTLAISHLLDVSGKLLFPLLQLVGFALVCACPIRSNEANE